jgi:hypothetical protein
MAVSALFREACIREQHNNSWKKSLPVIITALPLFVWRFNYLSLQ